MAAPGVAIFDSSLTEEPACTGGLFLRFLALTESTKRVSLQMHGSFLFLVSERSTANEKSASARRENGNVYR
jgi:hypothetical protein